MSELISPQKYSALLFDCDGTIADSMPVHLKAWTQALAQWGAHMTAEQNQQWAGQPARGIVAHLNQLLGLDMPAEPVEAVKEAAYLNLVSTVRSVVVVERTIKTFYKQIPFAVAIPILKPVYEPGPPVIAMASTDPNSKLFLSKISLIAI